MESSLFALEVRVHGRRIREYSHQGQIYVEGRKGKDFTLRLINNSNNVVLAVPTVDGLSIMDGEPGSYDSGGYVMGPQEHMDIPGWRRDDDKVAKFFFSKEGQAYAAKMEQDLRNLGVIGVAFFREKEKPKPITGILRSRRDIGDVERGGDARGISCNFLHTDGASKGGSDFSVTHSSEVRWEGGDSTIRERSLDDMQNLGTGFGKETTHKVRSVAFEKASNTPDAICEITYDDKAGLKARGIDVDRPDVAANPFPAQPQGCKPPPGYQG
jgi:hypothetical protein